MNFREWLESAALATGAPPTTPPINNDGDDDDGEFDDWDKIERRYGAKIRSWVDGSNTSKYMKGKILEALFKQQPRVKEISLPYLPESGVPTERKRYVELRVEWKCPLDRFWQPIHDFMRGPKSDLWKALGVDSRQIWSMLDKGRLFEFIFHRFLMSLSGIDSITSDKTQSNWGSQWQKKHIEWLQDKLTISKYARFVTEQDWMKRFENRAKKEVMGYYNGHRVRLSLAQEPRMRGQVYGRDLMAEAYLVWEYEVSKARAS